jgi:hypothetical protein
MYKLVIDATDLECALAQDERAVRDKLAAYRSDGFEIVVSMPASLSASTDEGLCAFLEGMSALVELCDTVVFGGPDTGANALHLDDKAVTPAEFLGLSCEALNELLKVS